RSTNGEVRLTITGRIEVAHVAELQRLVDADSADHRRIVLDLKDVKLVDREAVTFFVRCEARGIKLENCPAYVREWIRHEVAENDKGHWPAASRHRRRRVRGPGRRQGAPSHARRGGSDRPEQPPRLPATALPGGHLHAHAVADRFCNPSNLAQ